LTAPHFTHKEPSTMSKFSELDIDRQNAATEPNLNLVTHVAKVQWIADMAPLEGPGSDAEIGEVSVRSLRIIFHAGRPGRVDSDLHALTPRRGRAPIGARSPAFLVAALAPRLVFARPQPC
jgi:hypothetical protein